MSHHPLAPIHTLTPSHPNRVLLSMKVDVDALDDDGWTPLHAAVYWRNMEAAELLVSHGADITRATKIVSV